jgi:hypothetical protein
MIKEIVPYCKLANEFDSLDIFSHIFSRTGKRKAAEKYVGVGITWETWGMKIIKVVGVPLD